MNCTVAVVPVDSSPIRSPQAVHTSLARRFAGRSIVEIGTRNGDGMACFAQVARSAVAIELSRPYCTKLQLRAAALRGQQNGGLGFNVSCGSYTSCRATSCALPETWDYVTWWQQLPHLSNRGVLEFLREQQKAGKLRLPADAQAVMLFDLHWKVDRQSWASLHKQVAWSEEVAFDEQLQCEAAHGKKLCARAKGVFRIAGIAIAPAAPLGVAIAPSAASGVVTPQRSATAFAPPTPQKRDDANLVAARYNPAADTNRHAICLTGGERSFGEIGQNVREGMLHSLGTAAVTLFGVRPSYDPWTTVRRLLPLHDSAHTLQVQERCFTGAMLNLTITWLHCDMRGRSGDCRASALQELCDLSRCEQMIRAVESARGRPFDTVLRLRADLFWEARLKLPALPVKQTIYIPELDSQGGANDHLAFGERAAMARYLSRVEHVMRAADATVRSRLINTESYLAVAMKLDGVSVVRLHEWMYCLHTRKNMLAHFNIRGCIGRVRCRTRCKALACPLRGLKSGDCTCLDASCAALTSNRSNRAWVDGGASKRNGGKTPFGCFGSSGLLKPSEHCVDVARTQLHHRCTYDAKGGASQKMSGCRATCAWPRDATNGAPLSYDALSALPACILPGGEADAVYLPGSHEAPLLEGGRQCGYVSRGAQFTNTSEGVFAVAARQINCPAVSV